MLRLEAPERIDALAALQARLANKGRLLAPLAEPALEAVRENFRAGGRPIPWAPLKGGGKATLIASGRLLHSIRAEVRGDRLVLATSLPYGALHQFGGRHTPARPFLVLPPSEVARLAGLVAAELGGIGS